MLDNRGLGMESTTAVNSEQSPEKVILVVDDDPDILEALSDILLAEGFAVRRARNGQEALARLSPAPPDLILLDLMMPVMDGWQFAHELRSLGYGTPLLVLSADQAVERHANQLLASAYLAKPFDLDELLGKVRQLVGAGSR